MRAVRTNVSEPDILRRLPPGVEFTFVRMILSQVPDVLTTQLWTDPASADPLVARFQTKTYGAVDRALDKESAALNPLPLQSIERQRVNALRREWTRQVAGEVAGLPQRVGAKVVASRWVDPARLGPPRIPTGLDGPGMVSEVWRLTKKGRMLVERWALPAVLMPWREGAPVPRLDPDTEDAVHRVIVRTHFRAVLRLRVGHRWRTRREPAGWPVLTQHVIPTLYDYLCPYYRVRPYRHRRRRPSAGHFPVALRRDIIDLVKLERPQVGTALTLNRVTAIIQRYVRHAPPDRPMGRDMFRERMTAPEEEGRKEGPRK